MVFNFRLHKISLYAHSTVAGHWNNFRSEQFWVMWRKVGKKGIAPFNIYQEVIKTENEIYSSSTFWCFNQLEKLEAAKAA